MPCTNAAFRLAARLAPGDGGGARQALASLSTALAEAKQSGNREQELLPSGRALRRMIELALDGATASDWDALEADAEQFLSGQPLIEFYLVRAGVDSARGRTDAAARSLGHAAQHAERIPTVMRSRIERELTAAQSQIAQRNLAS